MYTFHQKTSTIPLHIMLIQALVLESVGFHYFLHQWSEIAAWILLALNGYTLLLFLGEIQAIRLCPVQLTDDNLVLQISLMKSLSVPLKKIDKVQYYDGPEQWSKQELKTIFDGTAADFVKEKPTFELLLKEPITAHYLYGFEKKVNRIFLNIDEPDTFYQTLKSRLDCT